MQTAIGIVGEHKSATVLTAQDGKDAQSHVGHVVDSVLVEYGGIQDARWRRGAVNLIVMMRMTQR